MISTTPRQRAALLTAFPELLDHTLPAVRLHPRPGAPTAWQSSVGGPLLWPRDEPWPTCSDPHSITKTRPMRPEEGRGTVRWVESETPVTPVAMIPVAQLFRAEAGDLAFPEGTDVLQILWCPNNHQAWRGPRPVAFWRDSTATADILPSPPPCGLITNEGYVPQPCVAHPEPLMEYPPISTIADLTDGELLGQLPADLERRLRHWDRSQPEYESYLHLAHAPGWKIGGWDGSWPDTGHLETCRCGAPMRPLLEVDRTEWLGGTWAPRGEPHFPWGEPRRWEDEEPTRVDIGRNGMYWVHICSADGSHSLTHGLE